MEEISGKVKLQISAAAMELDRSVSLLNGAQMAVENFSRSGKIELDDLTNLQNIDYASQIVKCVSGFLEIISSTDEHSTFNLTPRDVTLRILSGKSSS